MSNTRPQRISEKLLKDLQEVSIERINKKLANPFKKNETSVREMTELMTKTVAYRQMLQELKTKPKKR